MNRNYTLAFQNLLYKKPLYEYIGEAEKNMNILVLGWNSVAEVFIDQCLQAGQMDSHTINISILTADAQESMKNYLDSRLAMPEFVNVNGSLNNSSKSSFGILNFLTFEQMNEFLSPNERQERENIILNILSSVPGEKYHYYLVDFDNDFLNEEIADVIAKVNQDLEEPCAVNYVVENTKSFKAQNDIFPVFINGTNGVTDIDPNLEQMAFNVHLSWKDSIIGDPVSEYDKFKNYNINSRDEYNYLSSVAMALSVKYKLAEFGIDICDTDKAAEDFENMLLEDEQQEKLRDLSVLEHRRWVLEKAADGWKAPDPNQMDKYYQDCFERCDVKDEENRLHLCMVRSSAEPVLSLQNSFDKDFWDNFVSLDDGLEQVSDELDRMSIRLHRVLLKKADNYRETDPLNNPEGNVKKIENELKRKGILDENQSDTAISNPVAKEWKKFILCLSYILDKNRGYSKKYEYYRESFKKAAKDMGVDVEESLLSIDKEIWPSIEANNYRDYRAYDDILVKNIPFILTYRVGMTLALPFSTTKTMNSMIDILFQNVASATVIKPKRIIYLLNISEKKEESTVRPIVEAVRKYFKNREMKCEIYFIAIGSESLTESKKNKWKRTFNKLSRENLIQHDIVFCSANYLESLQNAVGELGNEGQEISIDFYDGTSPLFSSMQDNAMFIRQILRNIPYFEFDSRNKKFHNNETCRFLSYIKDNTYLSIEEMFSLSGAEDIEFNFPNLREDYSTLWGIYKGQGWIYEEQRDCNETKIKRATLIWKTLCNALKELEEINGIASDSVVEVSDLMPRVHSEFNKVTKNDEEIDEQWDLFWTNTLSLIKALDEKNFLMSEKEDDVIIGFTFVNQEIHKLLTKAGDMLEIYVYYSVCESGWFDDIATGYHFHWYQKSESNKLIDNELDLVVTKGFRSMIIECKDTNKIKQDYYFKLESLAHLFGINSQGVLVTTANTKTSLQGGNLGENKKQEERGIMMGIKTISRKNDQSEYSGTDMGDIEHISEKLRRML